MNKKNRKGFTIVELVIVIAVIAILATVLVPTFGNVIENAKNTALIQEIKNEHTNYTMEYATEDVYEEDVIIQIGTKYYEFKNGEITMDGEAPKEVSAPCNGWMVYNAETGVAAKGTAEHDYNDTTPCTSCGAEKPVETDTGLENTSQV